MCVFAVARRARNDRGESRSIWRQKRRPAGAIIEFVCMFLCVYVCKVWIWVSIARIMWRYYVQYT